MIMNGSVTLEKLMPKTRRAVWLGVCLALVVLGITILSGVLFVRNLVREQIAQREGRSVPVPLTR